MPPLVEVRHLVKHFPRGGGLFRPKSVVRAVDDVSFDIEEGETFALVGESGSGKSTTGRCMLRLVEPTSGQVRFRGEDVLSFPGARLRAARREMQMVFQDPYSSLNPRMTLLDIIGEPLLVNGVKNAAERRERVEQLLQMVNLPPEFMQRYPHAFSGGQRQRIGIARALALNPPLIVADEPVSALDVSVQAQIVNLLLDLQDQLNVAVLFVAHDLSVVKHMSHRVAVMYVGKIVEVAETRALFHMPQHPYTEALLSAVPKPDPRLRSQRIILEGDVADPAHPPSGCYFHPRCRYAVDRCKSEAPTLRESQAGHWVSCHRAEELTLVGVAE